ncbi:hypothetical protein H5410_034947 [Solanum commersonii]|uniref:Uncharacterized protein n=1 Tax=Solanum commersonii TaxID=4109 RepID=A0A9J5XZC3_SOLCO|nr:hypothetical protein H5410_034947 [Solanum commersonii]
MAEYYKLKLWRVLVLVFATNGVKTLRGNVIMVTIVIMYVQMRDIFLEENVCGKAFLREWLVCVSIVVDSKIIIKQIPSHIYIV